MTTFLILDANYLCHRARWTTGHLSHEGRGTGIAYGVLTAVDVLTERFGTDRVLFAFDRGYEKRTEIFPEYKQNRRGKPLSDQEHHDLCDFRRQVDLLRNEILPLMGYRNVFWRKGYEADDVIASLNWDLAGVEEGADESAVADECIIVSADQDLWQLLSDVTRCYNPQTKVMMTKGALMMFWGVTPRQWVRAKAIAGCDGDGVPGVKGVGMKTACKWEAGTLKMDSVAWRRINKGTGPLFVRNYKLVLLPFPGIGSFVVREDTLTAERRAKVFEKLGFQERRPAGVKREVD